MSSTIRKLFDKVIFLSKATNKSFRSIFSSYLVRPSAVSHDADSLLSSCTDSIVDLNTAMCHTNGVGYLTSMTTVPPNTFQQDPNHFQQTSVYNVISGCFCPIVTFDLSRTKQRYHPYDSHIPLANDPAQNVGPTAASQSDTTMTIL